MVSFKNSHALLLLIALSSLFLNLTFANDYPSPSQAPIVEENEVDGSSSSPGGSDSELAAPAPIAAETEVNGPSLSPGGSESELVAPVSFISSAPVVSPASSPSLPSSALPVSFISSAPVVSPASSPSLPSSALPVSFISSAPVVSPASSPSPPSSASSSSSSLSLSSFSTENVGEIYGVLETSATVEPVHNVAAGMDVRAKVSKIVGTNVIALKFRTEEFIENVIAKRLHNPETEDETRECLKQCKENYNDANDDVSKVMDDLSTGDYYKAMVDVEGISTFVDTCSDCLKEMVGEEPQFKKFDEWVRGVTGNCLEQLEKVYS